MTLATTSRRSHKLAPARERRFAKHWSAEHSAGWITYRRPFAPANEQHPLTLHAPWAGPVKLVESSHGGELFVRYDFHLDQSLGQEGDPTIDADLANENELLETAFAQQAEAFAEADHAANWTPPPVEALSAWLRLGGYEPTEDEDHNLRLSIRRRGATGQVKLLRETGRLRLTMPLGRWSELPPENRHAMQKLASLANSRCRLARVVWEHRGNVDACEAQVDLSGLPYMVRQTRRVESFWREMMSLSMTALDFAVAMLAMELGVLADDKEQELVRLMPC
jgi:hypothetical protein